MSTICDDLRKSILRTAITGRLTEQLASDAPIKKVLDANNILHDNEKEYPFDIPENWAWVKLKAVANVQYGFPFNSQLFNKNEKGTPLIRIRDILPAKTSTYTTEKAPENYLIKKNDMLVGMDGNFNVNFWNSEDAYLNQRCCKIAAGLYLEQKLLYWFLQIFLDEIFENVSYTTVKHLSDRHLTKMSIPLPPLAEQKRIIEKVDELMARVADLEQSADALASLKKTFPDDIKASLLQAAMQGKLTKQLPEDGSAEDLLEEIKAEKEKLIAEGKIKKQKPLAPITDDEIPFSIPENWKWERFGNLGSYRKGPFGSALTKSIFIKDSANAIKVYEQKNAIKKDASLGDYFISREYYEDKMKNFRVLPGDIIVSCAGTIGETFILPEGIREGIINQALMRMRMFNGIYIPYFLIYFDYIIKASAISNSKGSAIKNIPPFEVLYMYPVAIPPLAEQKRIVERLNTFMQNINVVGDLIASE